MAQDNRSFESTLHDIVYSIDAGTGLKIIRTMIFIFLILFISMVYTATQFRGLNSAESMELSQLGRNLTVQNGMTTKCIRPFTMREVASRNAAREPMLAQHPDLMHPPAYPALLSIGFKAFELIGVDPFRMPETVTRETIPAEKWVIMPVNHMFVMLTGLSLFLMGKRLFSREIGLVGCVIYFLSDLAWQNAVTGLNISMAIFFITAAFHALIVAMMNRRNGESKLYWLTPYLLSIVFASIAFLTRYLAAAAVPGLCLFAWLMAGRFRGGTRFAFIYLLLFTMLISPWLIRNVRISGNPLGLAPVTALADTAKFPEDSLMRDYFPPKLPGSQLQRGEFEGEVTFSQIITQMKHKWIRNYSGEYSALIPGMGGGIITALFLVTFFYHFVRPQVNDLRWSIGLSMLVTLFVAGFFSDSSIRMVHAFWPFIILYGLAFFYILIDRLDLGVRLYTIGLKVLLVILTTIPMILAVLPPHANRSYPPYHPWIVNRISEMLTPREMMCTDMPWATAWYGDRISLLMPENPKQFYEINDTKQYISGIYLTALTMDKPFAEDLLVGPEREWWPILVGNLPADFPLKKRADLNPARRDQIFYSDRERWAEPQTGNEL